MAEGKFDQVRDGILQRLKAHASYSKDIEAANSKPGGDPHYVARQQGIQEGLRRAEGVVMEEFAQRNMK